MTWEDRLDLLRKRLGRELKLDEMLAEARLHKMTPGEIELQRESWVRGMMPTGDPRFDTF